MKDWTNRIMLLFFNLEAGFGIEKMVEDELSQLHQKKQMLWVLLSRSSAKSIVISAFIWKTKCNTQPQVKKQERWLVMDQTKQVSNITRGEKTFF